MKKKTNKPIKNKRSGGNEGDDHIFVRDWLFSGDPSSFSSYSDGFGVDLRRYIAAGKVLFELHCHSNRSDGVLSPAKLVERANANGVKVLALTDHDTMAGIPEAVKTAHRFRMKIIPGVEISTRYSPSSGKHGLQKEEEMVHILAYYGSCGPHNFDRLEKYLSNIREGRFIRAEAMVNKLNSLNIPLKLDSVTRIAGSGAAPGRVHVARAMVEAGYAIDIKQAFSLYLHDGGPAYSTGSEPLVEDTVHLIAETGGVSVMAHPWSLKDPFTIIRNLKQCGLDGLEVYRSDGIQKDYSEMADTLELMKVGGSDYHGTRGRLEPLLGSVFLSGSTTYRFLVGARAKWCKATCDVIKRLVDEQKVRPRPAMEFLFGEDEVGCCGFLLDRRRKTLMNMYTYCFSKMEGALEDDEFNTVMKKLSAIEF